MTERRPMSSSETPPNRQVSANERNNLKKLEQINIIYDRAKVVKDELVANKVRPNAIINIVLEPWPDESIENRRCWIITNRPSMHKLGTPGKQSTTGYALRQNGEIIEYETEDDIKDNPTLNHVLGKHLGEIIIESPFDPEVYLDNGIMHGLDELSDRAKIATNN